MQWSDLKVKTKLTILIGMTCVALAVVAGLGFYGIRDTAGGINEADESIDQVAVAGRLVKDFLTIRLDLVYMMLLPDTARQEEKQADMVKKVAAVREGIKQLNGTAMPDREKELFREFSDGFEAYLVQGEKLAKLSLESTANGGKDHAAVVDFATKTVAPLYTKPAEAIAGVVDIKQKAALTMSKEDAVRATRIEGAMVAVGLACIALATLFGAMIFRSITRPLARVMEVLATVASGDLKARSGFDSRDEMGVLAREVDGMAEKLAETIGRVSTNSIQVSVAANRVHKLADGLAKNSEILASQSTTIATASEEMAATSSDIARNCNDAAHEGRDAGEVAASGAEVVDRTVTGMARIAEQVKGSAKIVEELGRRSNQIGEIVGTIEDIADQTNLLALNAAIEAARAGEQGRGFAVVADEVRALAERTTRATREIGDMIKSIQGETRSAVAAMEEGVAEVERGSEGAAQSGEALQHILQRIDVVTSQVNQIATAAEEQTATTTEVSRNIMNVTEIAHATSNESRDITAEANKLNGLSAALMEAVESFRIEESNSLIINKAKSAHMIFVGKIQAHLDGASKTDPSTLPDHHGCNFGKWYDTMGTDHCGHLQVFKDIVQPHAKVHELGKAAIVAYNGGDRQKAAVLCREMVDNSVALLGNLEALEKQCA
ncbi:methyl-accepting chemotaxis protein [Geobacter sp. AOG2]|uniref:methyl-accepting chemotaxis protein n=1 Tax=Geobacter sp. AOG2 TaxID=1566347 RepID=UPI001CC6EADE|nr:methyl-accepting chemotaxis protein [Geobacter sp. AOG2]GFE62800.1 methyl-accepting chemotaxis protein [Geobacter sp. AOG2]